MPERYLIWESDQNFFAPCDQQEDIRRSWFDKDSQQILGVCLSNPNTKNWIDYRPMQERSQSRDIKKSREAAV